MINLPGPVLRHKMLLTVAASLVVLSACAGETAPTTAYEPPSMNDIASEADQSAGDDFWHEILQLTEEAPSLELEPGGPTAIALPFTEAEAEIAWATEGDVSVYAYTDSWQLQKPSGQLSYAGAGWLAFLSKPTAAVTAFIGFGSAAIVCGDNADLLDGDGTAWTGPSYLSRPPAQSAAEGLVPGRASTDAGLAVSGYNGCPAICPTPVAGGGVTHTIPDSGSSWSFFASIGGPDKYYGWAEYTWNVYVKCS